MKFIVHHSIKGNLLLPIIFIVLLMNFTTTIPVLQDAYVVNTINRGDSAVSVDLEASFKEIPGGAVQYSSGTGAEGSKQAGAGRILNLREGPIAKTYLGKVLRRIEANKFYPDSELDLGNEGIAKVSFVLMSNGKLTMLRLLKGSGNSTLDSAAVSTVEGSQPFPAFPKGLEADSLPIVIDIEYKLEG